MRTTLTITAALLAANPVFAQSGTAADYSNFVPTTELTTTDSEPPDTALVQRLFTLAFTEPCNAAIDGGYGGPSPTVFDFTYKGSYDEGTAPERQFRLYQFNCNGGAYNFSSVFYGWDEISGLQPLSFSHPTVKPTYEDLDDNPDGRFVNLEVTGIAARFLVTNAEVDEETGDISSAGYWRGIGDASSVGTWRLLDGEYVLVTYDVDPSYNGEVDPIRIYPAVVPLSQ